MRNCKSFWSSLNKVKKGVLRYIFTTKSHNSIFIFRAISFTSVGKPPCFLHFLPCLHMALSYQTVSKTLT
jgi:hypothetical protein